MQDDYKEFSDYERVSLIKPYSEDPRNFTDGNSKCNFQGETTYSKNFVRYQGVERAKSFKKCAVYERPKEKLQGESTMKSQYKGRNKFVWSS
jgi:hypothetical protein